MSRGEHEQMSKEDVALLIRDICRFTMFKSLTPAQATDNPKLQSEVIEWWTTLSSDAQISLEQFVKDWADFKS